MKNGFGKSCRDYIYHIDAKCFYGWQLRVRFLQTKNYLIEVYVRIESVLIDLMVLRMLYMCYETVLWLLRYG